MRRIRIRLTCGCVFKNYDAPFSPNAKYGCPNNMGHGYMLGWTSWSLEGQGLASVNPKHL